MLVPENGHTTELLDEFDLDVLAVRLLDAVQEAATGFDAVVSRAGHTVSLEESSPGMAAPLRFAIDGPQEISCFPGSHGMRFGLWRGDFEQVVESALEIVAAMLAGTYTERVKEGGGPRHPKIIASWPDAGGSSHQSGLNTFLGVLNDDNSVLHHYDPYRPKGYPRLR